MKAADVFALIAENESLHEALRAERADKLKWFDIALQRHGTIAAMAGEISILKSTRPSTPPSPPAPDAETHQQDRGET